MSAAQTRPPLLRGQTMPARLPSLDDAVAAYSFTQGSRDAIRRVLAAEEAQSQSAPLPPTPSQPSSSSPTAPSPLPPPKLPSISCSAVPRDGRPTSSRTPVTLSLESQSTCHILSAPLGPNFSSDSITIALKRNYVLVIIADCWSSETECHYEWSISFDRDADMARIQANFNQGLLKVTVPRLRT